MNIKIEKTPEQQVDDLVGYMIEHLNYKLKPTEHDKLSWAYGIPSEYVRLAEAKFKLQFLTAYKVAREKHDVRTALAMMFKHLLRFALHDGSYTTDPMDQAEKFKRREWVHDLMMDMGWTGMSPEKALADAMLDSFKEKKSDR